MTRQTLTSVIALDGRSRTAAFAPDERLSERVETYWTLSVEEPPARVRVIPDGRVDLVFDLDHTLAHVGGVSAAPFEVVHERATHLLGATLTPGAAAPLLGVSVAELGRDWQPLEGLVGEVARELAHKLASAASQHERLALLDGFLLARVGQVDARVQRAVREIAGSKGQVEIGALGKRSGASPRSLSRLFHEWVGITPKRFARIVRAQAAMRRIAEATAPELSEIALDLGYADQAHMTREVREVAGAAPVALAETFKRKAVSFKS